MKTFAAIVRTRKRMQRPMQLQQRLASVRLRLQTSAMVALTVLLPQIKHARTAPELRVENPAHLVPFRTQMNRAVHLFVPAPDVENLTATAEGMAQSASLKGYLQSLAKAYNQVRNKFNRQLSVRIDLASFLLDCGEAHHVARVTTGLCNISIACSAT